MFLCHPDDRPAQWLAGALRSAGAPGVEVVTVEQLVFSRRIVHHMDGAGDNGAVHLADGRVLRPESIGGLVNRVRYLPTQHFASAGAADRAYATAELGAFLLAWLHGVAGPVINPALPMALDGGTFDAGIVMHHASVAGLPTTEWRAGTEGVVTPAVRPVTHVAIVFQWRLFGALVPAAIQEGCRRLAALLGVPLLQVMLHRSAGQGWRFAGATGVVDFRAGGVPLAAALARAFRRES